MRRRGFLATAGMAVCFPTIIPRRVLSSDDQPGANDRLQIGFIGVGGRARWILEDDTLPGAEVVAVADCDLSRCREAARVVPGGERWGIHQDYRAMLEREKLDAVFVETTTHARVRACLHVLRSGRDVYGEKPISLTVDEGRYLVDAVRESGRVFQAGTQQRSMPINIFASRLTREGAIGEIKEVITCNFEPALDWMPRASRPIPDGLNWDLWCDQTPLVPYHPEIQHGWSKYIEYDGGGQSYGVTGWGTHSLDQAQCALGADATGPVEIEPAGAGPARPVSLRYANGTVLRLIGERRGMEDLGAIFVGERGRIEIRRGSAIADPPELLEDAPPDSPCGGPKESLEHIRNFFDCVRSRATPNASVEAAHRSTTVCHLVNIARTLGRKLAWDPTAERFSGDDQANEMLSRPRREGYELPSLG